jgi:DNA-binding transcriptional MerR regulator
MQEHQSHLTIEELAEQADIPVRTIRYYITEGLLPGPEGRGKATTYGEEHLLRLRLIRLLSQQRMPLTEMLHLLSQLSLAEVQMLLAEEEQRARELDRATEALQPQEYIATLLKNARAVRQASFPASRARHTPAPSTPPPAPSPAAWRVSEKQGSYESIPAGAGTNWERWELAPGVELHIQEGANEQHSDLIERIFKLAGVPFPRLRK